MNTETEDSLAKMVAAKLNHDYVSPLTAISNGIEIYKLDEASRVEAIDLIEESLKGALSELQFNRIAFGSYGDEEQISLNEVKNRINKFFERSKFTLEIIDVNQPPFKYDAKLWYLCILCMRSSFVNLSELSIAATSHGWQLIAAGEGMMTNSGEVRAETEWLQIAKITPNTVHFPLLFIQAEKMNYDIIFKRSDDNRLTVNFWRKKGH